MWNNCIKSASVKLSRGGLASLSAKRSVSSLEALGDTHVTKGLGRVTSGIIAKGEGSYVTFEDGRRMLDFTCGIGVTNLGHCHPAVSQAAAEQCLNIVHAQCSIAYHGPYLRLIEQLLPLMPHKSLDSFFFWNSGTEAIEAAIKIARVLTKKQNIIVMQGGYHGRTFGSMALTKSKTIYSEGCGPLMPGVFGIPFPHWHQQNVPADTSIDTLVSNSLYQLSLLLAQQTSPKDTAAILIEPLIGEGGYIPAPPQFLQALREICDQNNILLIIDEVQSGFGRTGKMFMIEESGVKPDILTLAKGLANGFPLSAVVSRKELTDKLTPGTLGGTYAGNAVSCAAAEAVAKIFRDPSSGILSNVNARSSQFFSFMNTLSAKPHLKPHFLEVRGQGLMVAVEFASPVSLTDKFHGSSTQKDYGLNKDTPKGMAGRVAKKCVEKGMLILTTSVYEVIRFIPPLNISEEDMAKGLAIFEEAVEEVVKEG